MKYRPWVLFFTAGLLTILAGRWAMSLIVTSEYVHFSANFPTYEGAEVLSRDKVGGPWSMLPDREWNAYPAGGVMVWGRQGAISFDVGRQSFLKRLAQPWDLTLATYWIRNVGSRPRRVRLDLDMCGMPVEWVTFESDWNNNSKTTTRDILPGKTFAMDWHVHVPPERRNQEVVCSGGLKIMDVKTDKLLTFLPIEIINSEQEK